MREALKERGLLLNVLAPHLVTPVPFLLPLTERWQRAYIGAGLFLYDSLGGHEGLPRHRHLTKRGRSRSRPRCATTRSCGAIQYYDAKVDDARHTMTVARTAAEFGAAVVSNTRVVGFLRAGERVTGVRVRDELSGNETDVRARRSSTRPASGPTTCRQLVGERGKFKVRASKGIHLVVPRDRLQLDTGLILRTEKSVLFVIPWGRHWIIGTTDTDWDLDKAHPAASAADIDYVLEHVNAVLEQPLTHADVEGVYAGLRPLLTGESESRRASSRASTPSRSPVPGMVAVAGGKYTTYRVMARDAIDVVARKLDRTVPESATHVTPLLGASGFQALWNRRECVARTAACTWPGSSTCCGATAPASHDLLDAGRGATRSSASRCPAPTTIWRSRSLRVSHEGALHLDDVLAAAHADLDRDLGPRARGLRATPRR